MKKPISTTTCPQESNDGEITGRVATFPSTEVVVMRWPVSMCDSSTRWVTSLLPRRIVHPTAVTRAENLAFGNDDWTTDVGWLTHQKT
ncbi:unnamed protein product [Heligmosomoides polygyrus]|uniref:Transposase n=1 Tax=Heligmosomoides polygyrus TaxID=6339 RepID=A0A183FGX4_HELPZ|nr:unnamed protein product [Heligmosomoides polygyrus]